MTERLKDEFFAIKRLLAALAASRVKRVVVQRQPNDLWSVEIQWQARGKGAPRRAEKQKTGMPSGRGLLLPEKAKVLARKGDADG